MKNTIYTVLFAVIILAFQSCEKEQDFNLKTIPEGMQLLSHVNTYYSDHTVVDSFYYNHNFKLTKMVRINGDLITSFHFENKKLSESKVVINQDGQTVSYYISYMNDGKLSVTNDTTAYILSNKIEGNLYSQLTCYTRKPFTEWDEKYSCEFSWEDGNLKSACVDRVVTQYNYDDRPNPMAGYIVWGFFFDDLFVGSTNNRIQDGYHYEYNEHQYPSLLSTPTFSREYSYN